MSSLSRRACFKCGNVGHYAGTFPCSALALLWDLGGTAASLRYIMRPFLLVTRRALRSVPRALIVRYKWLT